jgi:Restriction alleviation protein Lar
MKINKLKKEIVFFEDDRTISIFERFVFNKINELIDAFNENEKNRSEQMARFVDKINSVENQIGRVIKDMRAKEEEKEPAILPCPWCNNAPEVAYSIYEETYTIQCRHFDCIACPQLHAELYTKQEAIDAWNKRA